MWIFSKGSFLSVVAHSQKKGILLVRSRFPGHIEQAFPGAMVRMSPDADYTFRAELPAKQVSAWLAAECDAIDYPNFKASLEKPRYADACSSVWHALRRFADSAFPRHRLSQAKAETGA